MAPAYFSHIIHDSRQTSFKRAQARNSLKTIHDMHREVCPSCCEANALVHYAPLPVQH